MRIRELVTWILQRFRGSFVRGVAQISGGTAIGHLLLLAVSPLVTRLYSPTDFGILGLVLPYIGLISSVGSLRYDMAIVSAKSHQEASQLFVLSSYCCLVTSLIGGVLLIPLRFWNVLGYGNTAWWIIPLVIICTFATSYYGLMRICLVRQRDYSAIGQVVILQNIGRAIGQVLLGVLGTGGFGLIVAELVCRFSGISRSFQRLRKGVLSGTLDWMPDRGLAVKYRTFPIVSGPSTIVNALATNLQVPVVAGLYGVDLAGQFMLVQRVFAAPMALVGGSLADVVHGRLGELAMSDPRKIRPFLFKLGCVILGVGIVPAIIACIWGPLFFSLAFGKQWLLAGEMSQWIIFWSLANIVVSPISRAVFVCGGQRSKMIYDGIVLLGVVIIPRVVCNAGLEGIHAIAWLSVFMCLSYCLYFVIILRIADSCQSSNDLGGNGNIV